ncbi:hypothetical protein INR49_029427, partial [Caranx melampygus]
MNMCSFKLNVLKFFSVFLDVEFDRYVSVNMKVHTYVARGLHTSRVVTACTASVSGGPSIGQYAGQSGLFRGPRHGSLPELELRYLQCTCCWRSRVPVSGFETLNATLSSTSEPCKDEANQPLDACYTSEQRDTILQLLNTASPAELAGVKLLRGRKSLNIVEYRTKNGPFKSLESVVNVPLLKHKSAVIVFNSILNPVKKEKKVRIQLAKFIRPEVDRSWLEDASSIVSIICGTNKVAWAHVDRGMTLLNWQQLDCPNFLKGTYMASSYLNDVSAVVSMLPSADFYIIEKPSISVQNTALFPIMAHMRTVEAMLFALLEPKISSPESIFLPGRKNNLIVLNMMRTAVGRHFGLMVGECRTSGAQTVRQLMTESVTQKLPRINFPQELLVKHRNSFQMGNRRGGEELCDALLQAVAFMSCSVNPPVSCCLDPCHALTVLAVILGFGPCLGHSPPASVKAQAFSSNLNIHHPLLTPAPVQLLTHFIQQTVLYLCPVQANASGLHEPEASCAAAGRVAS